MQEFILTAWVLVSYPIVLCNLWNSTLSFKVAVMTVFAPATFFFILDKWLSEEADD